MRLTPCEVRPKNGSLLDVIQWAVFGSRMAVGGKSGHYFGLSIMPPTSFQTFYDVSREWSSLIEPFLFTGGWLLAPFAVIKLKKTIPRGGPRLFLWLWLTGWILIGGFCLGNVWYQHFPCVH